MNATIHSAPPRTDDLRAMPTRFGRVVRIGIRVLLQRKYDIHQHFADRLPTIGPVLLAQNHLGALDGPLVVAMAPRLMHTLAKQEAFVGFVGVGMGWFGQIPVERANLDIKAIRQCVRELRAGRVVGVYPEGRRGAGDISVARGGLAYLALVTGAPVVPLALLGTRLPGADVSANPPRGTRIDLVYGEPITVAAQPYPRRQAEVRKLTELLRTRLHDHVQDAVGLTGNPLPGPPPYADPDAGPDEVSAEPDFGPDA